MLRLSPGNLADPDGLAALLGLSRVAGATARAGDRVTSPRFGAGTLREVRRRDGRDEAVVEFDDGRTRQLDLAMADLWYL